MTRIDNSSLKPLTKADLLASTSIFAILFTGWGSNPMLSQLPSPLENILNDINRAFDAGLYYPALVVALTLPEVCVSLTFDKEKFVKEEHYTNFINTYTSTTTLGLDGLTCYRLRGGVIHRGNAAGHPFFGSTHVIFTVPETGTSIHALTLQVGSKTSAMFDLKMFCAAMEQSVRCWYEDHKNDQKVLANIQNLLSWRPNGLTPFVGGAPLIGCGPE